jgi:uncharacterized membrane protein YhaH (DUF805 family)
MGWYVACIKKYATFAGRARRKEYWMFFLFNVIFCIVASIVDNILGSTIAPYPYGWIYLLYGLFVIIPAISVVVRRLHDVGKSGGYYFIALIPLIGGIWLLVLMCTEGNSGANQYGPDPKA